MTFDAALEHIEGFIAHRGPHQVVTVNSEFIMLAQHDAEFRRVLNHADLAVADGSGLMWASRMLDLRNRLLRKRSPKLNRLPELVTGSDLVPVLAEMAAHHGWKIYLLGGNPGVAQQAAEALTTLFPSLKIAGAESGPLIAPTGKAINDDQDALLETTLQRIKHARPDLLFVAFGAPKQDQFIARYREQLRVPVMIGVGGTFDFLAGRAQRAPSIFRLLWLEWLWRLLVEPWRFRRIFRSVVVFPIRFLLLWLRP